MFNDEMMENLDQNFIEMRAKMLDSIEKAVVYYGNQEEDIAKLDEILKFKQENDDVFNFITARTLHYILSCFEEFFQNVLLEKRMGGNA